MSVFGGSFLLNHPTNASQVTKVYFYWDVISQDPVELTSTIYWQLKAEGMPTNSTPKVRFTQVYWSNSSTSTESNSLYYDYDDNSYKSIPADGVLASGTFTVEHDRDGYKSIYMYAATQIYEYGTSCNNFKGTNIELPFLSGASTVTVLSGIIGKSTKILISKGASHYTHTLTYAFGDLMETIVENTEESEIDWTFPMSFLYQIPDREYGIGEIYCDTYSGSTHLGTYVATFRATAGDVGPRAEVVFEDVDPNVSSVITGYLRYMSDIKYTITAEAQYGASIASYRVKNGSVVYDTATGTFVDIADSNIEIIVTDTRGKTFTKTYSLVLNGYTPVTCNLSLKSADTDGTITMNVKGNYFNRDFYGAGQPNSLTLTCQCVAPDGTVITQTLTPRLTDGSNTYTAEAEFTGLDYKLTYKITAFARDAISEATSQEIAVTCAPVFDWSKTDFRFNVPVTKVGEYEWADFVVETGETSMGSNGKWYWRKWKSGRAECVGSRNFGRASASIPVINGTTTYGYRSVVYNQALPTGLFIEEPTVIDMRLKYTGADSPFGGIVWLVGENVYRDNHQEEDIVAPSAENTGSFAIFHTFPSGNGYNYTASHICFNVIGRWK